MKSKFINVIFLIFALLGIWMLAKFWVPPRFAIAGHDSGLALNSKDFLLTRFNAWDSRINFGVDNSPHFGSVIMHSIDYLLSIIGGTFYSGNQFAVFFWLSAIFICGYIFSITLKDVVGKYFKFLFPIFITFNFYILQSIFILERAKYELFCVLLIFLALVYKIINEKISKKKPGSIIKYSIILSLFLSVFNGGSWLGLPLYGGLIVTGLVIYISILFFSIKEKKYIYLKKISLFYLISFFLYVLLNTYSILPYLATLKSSAYGQLTDAGTITSGMEWLNYISRGSSFINLFRLQGIPDWYLTEFLSNPEHAYSGMYMSSLIYVFVSFLLPVVAFSSLFFVKNKKEKHIISFVLFLLLVSMFFSAGPNSPLGFIYNFLYKNIPGFSIFRSPYFKFGYAYIFSFAFLLAFALSRRKTLLHILLIIIGWFGYHGVIFNSKNIFEWQPGRSTLVKVPAHVEIFGEWIKDRQDVDGRILLFPPMDNVWAADESNWGYWSLSTIGSVTFPKVSFVTNDTLLTGSERGWVKKLYYFLEKNDISSSEKLASKLGIKYLLLRNDIVSEESLDYTNGLELVDSFGEWSLYKLSNVSPAPMIYASSELAKISENYFYFPQELFGTKYSEYSWVKFEEMTPGSSTDLLTKREFFNIPCSSCHVEHLGKYAQLPSVSILPNSPFYLIKEKTRDKLIQIAQTDEEKLYTHTDLILNKLSEIKSMESLNIDKQHISRGFISMLDDFLEINRILESSEQLRNDFSVVSIVYERLNPVQKHFRDSIVSSNFQYEKEEIRDLTMKILWQINVAKKHFDPLTLQGQYWSNEKLYDLNNLSDNEYRLLIDSESLPVDNKGDVIRPYKLTTNLNQEIKIRKDSDSRWLETENFAKNASTNEVLLTFPEQPSLFGSNGFKLIDFPEGQRGCLVGDISFFNKNKIYKVKLKSSMGRKNVRLYINENKNKKEGFLKGDIVTDVFLANPDSSYEYVFDPVNSAEEPSVYLCENDVSYPVSVTVEISEMYSPIVFAEKDTGKHSYNLPDIKVYEKPKSEYEISITNATQPFVLVFNQRFNSLWELVDKDDNIFFDHFSVDGYANGWLVEGKKDYNLVIGYGPNKSFEYGTWISVATLSVCTLVFLLANYKKRK